MQPQANICIAMQKGFFVAEFFAGNLLLADSREKATF
jgi:hypothetical protein